jgi:Flp pilus assembly protein TadG
MAGRRFGRGGRGGREKGISTVEVVILTPFIVFFAGGMVAMGLYAQAVSQVQQAAADAARMDSLQTDYTGQNTEMLTAAKADLGNTCDDPQVQEPLVVDPQTSGSVTAPDDATVAMLKVSVTCDLDMLGMHFTVTRVAYAPLDTYGGEQP